MAYASASKRCQRDALAVARQGGRRALRALKAACRDCDGSALVEATVVTPLIVSLYFGVFDFSWYFYNQQLVEAGVRDAARYMSSSPTETPTPAPRRIQVEPSTQPTRQI